MIISVWWEILSQAVMFLLQPEEDSDPLGWLAVNFVQRYVVLC